MGTNETGGPGRQYSLFVATFRRLAISESQADVDRLYKIISQEIYAFSTDGAFVLDDYIIERMVAEKIPQVHQQAVFTTLHSRLCNAGRDSRPDAIFNPDFSPERAVRAFHVYTKVAIRSIYKDIRRSEARRAKREAASANIEQYGSDDDVAELLCSRDCLEELEAYLSKAKEKANTVTRLIVECAPLSFPEIAQIVEARVGRPFTETAIRMRYKRFVDKHWDACEAILRKYEYPPPENRKPSKILRDILEQLFGDNLPDVVPG